MHARLILFDPGFHAIAPEVFKAARRERFPEAYAHLYADVGLSTDEYEAIGTAVDSVVRMKDGPGKAKRLRQLAVWTLRHLGLNGRASDDSRRQAVEDLFEWAQRHDGSRDWEAPAPTALIGYVVGVAESALALDLPFDPDGLAETAHAVAKADGLPVSLSDVRGTIRAIMDHGAITDWMLPEEVERQRTLVHDALIRSLRSPDCDKWLSETVCVPDMAEWLFRQMRTPEERALLRERLVDLREKGTSQASRRA